MNKKKKVLLTALSVALVAIIAIFGTVAYLMDTDSDVNVMTIGNVDIEQIEEQRENGKLDTFKDDKPLLPAVGTPNAYVDLEGKEISGANGDLAAYKFLAINDGTGAKDLPNAVDKIVTVKNTGKTNAYVRTIMAFEVADDVTEITERTHIGLMRNEYKAESNGPGNTDWTWEWLDSDVSIGGDRYAVAVVTHNEVLAPGETTIPSLLQVYMKSHADNEYVAKFGEDYKIYVVSQAVQADMGDMTAAEALDEAFYVVTDQKNPWVETVWDGETPDEGSDAANAVKPDATDETKTVTISTAEELAAFAAAVNDGETYKGYTVELASDIDLNNMEWTPIGNVVSYPGITFAGTFDGKNHTISNLNAADNTENHASSGLFGSITGVVKNVNLENVTVTSTHYAGAIVGFASANNGMKIENCHVNGGTITTTAEWTDDEKWDNGDKAGGIIGYCDTGDVVTGCSVKNVTIKGYRDIGGIAGHAKGVAYITNNTVSNVTLIWDDSQNYKGYVSVAEADLNAIIGDASGGTVDASNSGEVKIIAAASGQDSLAAAITAGVTNVELAAGTYTVPSVAKGKTLSITGTEDTVINADYAYGQSLSGANIEFTGVTVQGQTTGNYAGFTHVGDLVFNECIFEGKVTLYSNTVFNDCVFNNKNDYSIWTWGAKEVEFNNCTFNSGGKALLLYGGATGTSAGSVTTVLSVNGCVFNDDNTLDTDKAAIETGNDYNATYALNVTNIKVNGFADGAGNTNSNIWANKNFMDTDHLNVVIDGVDVY